MAMGTQTKTRSATNTNLSVALALLLASGGLAYMAGGVQQSSENGYGYGYGYNACRLFRFQLEERCATKYTGSQVTCNDGQKLTANSCTTSAEARALCGNRGVKKFNVGKLCEAQYKRSSGTCSDGANVTGYNGECKTASSLRMRAENECSQRFCGVVATGQLTIKQSDGSLPRLVSVGANAASTEVSMLKFNVQASVEDVSISRLKFLYYPVNGSDEQSSFRNFKLYEAGPSGDRQIGTAMLEPARATSTASVIQFQMSPLVIARDTVKTLVVKAVFNSTTEGTQSAMSPFIQLGNSSLADNEIVEAMGMASGASLPASAINGNEILHIAGSQVVLYRSFPTFSMRPVSQNLLNGVEQDIYSFQVISSAQGPIALKQLKFTVDVVDVGTPNNLQLSDFKLFRGQTEITDSSRLQILLPNGNLISHIRYPRSIAPGTVTSTVGVGVGTTVYATWIGNNEEQIPTFTSQTYTIKATATGFTNDSDKDYIRVRLANDQYMAGELDQVTDPYYLMAGSDPLRNLVLLGDQNLGNLTSADIIWSDISAAMHKATAATTTLKSTGDWFNGYRMEQTPLNYSLLIR